MTSDKMILNATLVFILNVSPKFEIVVPNLRPSYILIINTPAKANDTTDILQTFQ